MPSSAPPTSASGCASTPPDSSARMNSTRTASSSAVLRRRRRPGRTTRHPRLDRSPVCRARAPGRAHRNRTARQPGSTRHAGVRRARPLPQSRSRPPPRRPVLTICDPQCRERVPLAPVGPALGETTRIIASGAPASWTFRGGGTSNRPTRDPRHHHQSDVSPGLVLDNTANKANTPNRSRRGARVRDAQRRAAHAHPNPGLVPSCHEGGPPR
jgi:hypothetical protein